MQFEKMLRKEMGRKEMVIKFILGETTEAESLMVKQWMNENAGNKRYFDEIDNDFNIAIINVLVQRFSGRV